MIPLKKVEELILRHRNLETELSSGNIDKKLFANKSKEYSVPFDLYRLNIRLKKFLFSVKIFVSDVIANSF